MLQTYNLYVTSTIPTSCDICKTVLEHLFRLLILFQNSFTHSLLISYNFVSSSFDRGN